MNKFFLKTIIVLSGILLLNTGCVESKPRVDSKSLMNKNLDSLNIQTIQEAQVVYQDAKDAEADYFAPVTFSLATKELKKAIQTIELDYSKTQQINALAKSATNHYRQAIRITMLSKGFEKKDFANEDYILWYWQQLKNINTPTKTKLDLTKKNSELINDIRTNITTLKESLQESQNDYASLNKEYSELKKSNEKLIAVKKQEIKKEKNSHASLYDFAKSNLSTLDVEVNREGNGILLFVTGFKFEKKQAKLFGDNSEILVKITNIIKHEPKLKVEINAHTDSIGTVMQNQQLSEQRARNILKALAKVGSLDTTKITTSAYGESQPVTSNMLKEGRAKNRRIEIYIYK